MEAPTSSYTGSNLHNREHLFSLAPPCHPGFSGCNQMEAPTSCVQAPTWTTEDNSPPEHLPTSLKYKWLNTHSTLQINQFLPVFLCSLILVFCSLFCYSSLIQQVCSVSYLLSFCSASVMSIMLLLFCSRSAQFLHCFLFLCSSSFSYFFPIFHSERSTQFGLIHFLLYILLWRFHFPFQWENQRHLSWQLKR